MLRTSNYSWATTASLCLPAPTSISTQPPLSASPYNNKNCIRGEVIRQSQSSSTPPLLGAAPLAHCVHGTDCTVLSVRTFYRLSARSGLPDD
jgi:hypothetical protein